MKHEYSSRNKEEWFNDIRQTRNEGQRLDFKRTWDGMLRDDHQKHAIIRHFIALGNIALVTGSPSYLFFGVDDETRELYSLRDQYPRDNPRGGNNFALTSLMEDFVLGRFVQELNHWIDPEPPPLEIDQLEINDRDERKLVAWIKIFPPQTILCLKKAIGNYPKNTVFIRKGSNSLKLDPSQKDILSDYQIRPYINKEKWRTIALSCRSGEFSKIIAMDDYLPLRLHGKDSIAEERILKLLDKGERLISIIGPAGSGKSLLINRIAFYLANRHFSNDDFISSPRNEFGDFQGKLRDENVVINLLDELDTYSSPYPLPIFFSLRKAFESKEDFKTILARQLIENLNIEKPNHYPEFLDGLFSTPRSKWVLLLDGLDEVDEPSKYCSKLLSWLCDFPPNVQIVITTRPYIAGLGQWRHVKLDLLRREEIISLVTKRMRSVFGKNSWGLSEMDGIIYMVKRMLKSNKGASTLLRNHRALIAFCEYIIGGFHPPKGAEDRDTPWINKTIEYKSRIASKMDHPTPAILEDDLEPENPLYIDTPPEKEEEDTLIILPPEAKVLERVTNYMRAEEKKRKSGIDVDREDNLARLALEKSAWNSEWSVNELYEDDLEEWNCKEKMPWNFHLGFIENKGKNYRKLKYISNFYQLYLAAEYSKKPSYENDPKLNAATWHAARVRKFRKELLS